MFDFGGVLVADGVEAQLEASEDFVQVQAFDDGAGSVLGDGVSREAEFPG